MSRRPLSADRLEDRTTPVVWNNPWADPEHLTLSFAPDGTDVRGAPSQLFAGLEAIGTADWQTEVLRAFQTWAVQANINLAVVPDDGTPFGAEGPVQGSPLHGDIRIGATELDPDQLAVSTPFDLFGGWTGTVFLNTLQAFAAGGGSTAADLYTVLLQEAGHVLGLRNSPDPSSAMYTEYLGPRVGPTKADTNGLQILYGEREPDRFEGRKGNDTTARATPLQFVSRVAQLRGTDVTAGARPFVAAGDLTTGADVDVYAVRVPRGAREFTASLRTSGISLLTARLTVLDARGRVVESAVATDPRSGDLNVTVAGARPGAKYFLRVEGAADDVFGIGAYRLAVGTEGARAVAAAEPGGLVNDDGPGWKSSVLLGKQRDAADLRWDFTHRASLHGGSDTDTYRIKTRKEAPGTLVVAVWGLDGGKLNPVVTVTDQRGRAVAARMLSDTNGTYTLQVEDARPNSTYQVTVGSADPAARGNYFLGVDFRDQPVEFQSFAAATLTAAQPDVSSTLALGESQLIHFALSVLSADSSTESAARLIVRDERGDEVYTLFSGAGQPASGDVLLAPGTYTVILTGGTKSPTAIMPDLTVRLDGLVRSDPIGITPTNTAEEPTRAPTSPPPPEPVTTAPAPNPDPYTGPYRPI
jgi:hypothetical protein